MQISLEELLTKAATEPAHRPEFFQRLMQSDVWVIGSNNAGSTEQSTICDLEHWEKEDGQPVIPFFTSEAAFTEAGGAKKAGFSLSTRALFEMTRGEILFLNPGRDSGKEFTVAEIDALLSGAGNALTELSVREQGQTLLLSAVEQPPQQLTDSLKKLFSTYKPVRRAFIAWCKETPEQPGNLLIGIEASDDLDDIIQAAGHVAMDTLPDDGVIDFCEVRESSEGISHFFSAHIIPFYQRPHGSFLRGLALNGGQRIL
ncbi:MULTISPECIES: enhanced serine sensitivity protein SseB [Tatumella]|uniref:Enhanced serine sensitivity protein SseB n=1 Tax=Tatumella punctata TaxID=399969 RepID=A0ABW1VT14_9GAMM|nr:MULTISPECIES: enhanced serine sensitivity protein SseB [unclassified Tatumella]MBS0856944.1 enhanced serine sensitivity protein SseB C-terminal domain-containing protein [Tatumella sp. JGM16]MBS0893894.1 enhanced serine sensitivity protein SseB C-terminal domain-containing protein [Tatumella sp. JGM130]MBS0913713.1 enhanced serine sensitivity protein SseB C-terminal domain-containing protein [Tatumella sp. JGM91]